jgi:hypothetical protein
MRTQRLLAAALVAAALSIPAFASAAAPLQPVGKAPEPRFDRLHDYDEIAQILKDFHAAYPKWTRLESIGKSLEGRDLWLLTIHNPETGDELAKPALWVDGNTHANEVQGGEACLYTIDFVLKNYGRLPRVTELVDRAVLYVLPVLNVDGRAHWFKGPSNMDFPRTVMMPVDDDRDGKTDEDGPDDLDGDGILTQMRKKVPMGQGTHRLDPRDPRVMVEVEPGELGDWVQLGDEGDDDDGDGRVNEDTVGYVDPNRTWGYYWEPAYVQSGAGPYPLAIPETRAVALWALAHPNIAASQSFHNNGRMILRGPQAKTDPPYPPADLKAYDLIGKEGEKLLPGYRYFITWKDLYTVHGGATDHFYGIYGAIAFTNELYDEPADFDKDGKITDQELMKFNDLLTLGRQFVVWKPFNHPQYGPIEIGGYRKDTQRVPEGWMLAEEMHRNSAFVLFHAHQLPRLTIGEPTVRKAGPRLWRLEVPVLNDRGIPSMTARAVQNKLFRQDLATVAGGRVVASGLIDDPWLDKIELQDHRPDRLLVPGVEGYSTRRLFFLVEGDGEVTVKYDSLKGGKLERKVVLKETEGERKGK